MDESMPTFVGDPVAESTFAFAADNDARGPLFQVSVSHFFENEISNFEASLWWVFPNDPKNDFWIC